MNAPFLSIVIPTLNEENYLPRLLDDLAEQTNQAFELLVVDGQSEDTTVKKAEKFKDKLPLQILSVKRKNVSFQRNAGAEKARGRYVVFLDADVQLSKNFVKILTEDLEKYQPSFATTRLLSDSKYVSDEAIVRLANLTTQLGLLVERPFAGGYNFIVERQVFLKVGGFRDDIWHAEDCELSLRLDKLGYPLTILKRPTIIYSLRRLRHEGRLSVLRKNAQAAVHFFLKGPITKEIFSYPMGGQRYNLKKRADIKPQVLEQIETRVRQFLKEFIE